MGLATESTATAPSLDSALALAARGKDEERVLGVTLALSHAGALAADKGARRQLAAAADAGFIGRLLQSAPALQRIALALLRVLLVDEDGLAQLSSCLGPLAASCVRLAGEWSAGDADGGEAAWGTTEVVQAMEVLRQALRLAASGPARAEACAAADTLLTLAAAAAAPPSAPPDDEGLLGPSLALVQELIARQGAATGAALDVLQAACLRPAAQGSPEHLLALGLLAEHLQGGAPPPAFLDEALSAAVAAGTPARQVALHLAAAAISRAGLSFGLPGGGPRLGRLRPLLALMAGELRLGLEGHAPAATTCAACAALEATIVAFGREAAALEAAPGGLADVSDCLRQIHRAVSDVHCYCADLPADEPVPAELALVARVAAAWQLEDPRQFGTEFQRSLPALCRLAPADFAILLPGVHELHDWHLTPAFGKVLETAWECRRNPGVIPNATEVWRQCALMLTEVALDAAAYLPDAAIPEAPDLPGGSQPGSSAPGSLAGAGVPAPLAATHLPRPLQAADPEHPGVQRLCMWSCALWGAAPPPAQPAVARWELGAACGALLVSVPPEALNSRPAAADAAAGAWAAVADCLLAGPSADASTWRLAARLAGFALDRHLPLAHALAEAAAARSADWPPRLRPPSGAAPGMDDEEDEWAPADDAAQKAVASYLAALPRPARPRPAAPAAAGPVALDGLD